MFGTLSNQEAIDIFLVESASRIADAANDTALDITDTARVHIPSLRLDNTSRSHVEMQLVARWQLVVDEESVIGEQAQLVGRRIGVSHIGGTPLASVDGVAAAADKRLLLAVLGHVGVVVLRVVVVEQVVPDDGVGADARVAPVPVLGAGHDGLLTPVLVVVSDAVRDLVYFAVDGEVDDGLGVGDRVGPK